MGSDRKIEEKRFVGSKPNRHWPHGWDFAGERARPGCRFRRRARPKRQRAGALQNASRIRWSSANAPAFWSAVALHRFSIAHIIRTKFQTPFAPFVHPKLPLAARLGLCWGARPSRWPFSASRPPKAPEGWRTPRRFARFGGHRSTRQRFGVRWPSTAFPPRAKPARNFKRPLPRSSTPNCHWPHGWDFAGERARPGGRFRRRAGNRSPNYPQRRQARHICSTQNQK